MFGKARTKAGAAKTSFTMKALWRLAVWGGTAGAALALAVLASRSEIGSDRVHVAMASFSGRPSQMSQAAAQVAKRTIDPEAETKRLSEAVRVLTSDRDRLTTRVTALEQNLDDVTGSVSKQIEAARAAAVQASAPPWPSDEVPALTPPATIAASLAATPASPAGLPVVSPEPTPAAAPSEPPSARTDFAVDIGSGPTIDSLRVRWNSIRLSRPQLFEGLQPLVTISDNQKTSRAELHLVVGPLPSAVAATQLCTTLAALRIGCQPAPFDGHRMVLR